MGSFGHSDPRLWSGTGRSRPVCAQRKDPGYSILGQFVNNLTRSILLALLVSRARAAFVDKDLVRGESIRLGLALFVFSVSVSFSTTIVICIEKCSLSTITVFEPGSTAD